MNEYLALLKSGSPIASPLEEVLDMMRRDGLIPFFIDISEGCLIGSGASVDRTFRLTRYVGDSGSFLAHLDRVIGTLAGMPVIVCEDDWDPCIKVPGQDGCDDASVLLPEIDRIYAAHKVRRCWLNGARCGEAMQVIERSYQLYQSHHLN